MFLNVLIFYRLQTGLQSLLDEALVRAAQDQYGDMLETLTRVGEVPFDFTRRRMSIVVTTDGDMDSPPRTLLLCKGAVEEVLALCTHIDNGDEENLHKMGTTRPMSEQEREAIHQLSHSLNTQGLRVIAVAYHQVMPSHDEEHKWISHEKELVFCGFLSFQDPPKDTAGPAIKKMMNSGVKVKVLTGDNEVIARAICEQVELGQKQDLQVITGSQLDEISFDELCSLVEKDEIKIFAKLTPAQKSRVVLALKQNGHTVGFLGDGINDALALQEADVGISVDTGADLAKEAAGMHGHDDHIYHRSII